LVEDLLVKGNNYRWINECLCISILSRRGTRRELKSEWNKICVMEWNGFEKYTVMESDWKNVQWKIVEEWIGNG